MRLHIINTELYEISISRSYINRSFYHSTNLISNLIIDWKGNK